MRNLVCTLLALLSATIVKAAVIGQWNAFPAYHDITDIEPAGTMVYVLSSNDLFSYNTSDNSVFAYHKANTLSDTDIDYIAWNSTAKKLLIVYSDYNIDLLSNDNTVENISDYYSKTMTDDKTVNNVYLNGNYAYLCTAFGIIKLNMKDAEISETYNLGRSVTDCTLSDGKIYAQTAAGIYEGSTSVNLIDPANWTLSSASPVFSDDNDITVSTAGGYTEYIAYDKTNRCYWSNTSDQTLQAWTLGDDGTTRTVSLSGINADGPKYNHFFRMLFNNETLYTVGGGWYQFDNYRRPGTVQLWDGSSWTVFEDDFTPAYASQYLDVNAIAVDPLDNSHVMVASCSGVYEFKNGKFQNNYTEGNVSYFTAAATNNPQYVRTDGIIYDASGNMYCLNSDSKAAIIKLSADGTWSGMLPSVLTASDGYSMPGLVGTIIDSRDLFWFTNDHSDDPAVFCYDPTNETIVKFSNWTNQDGTSISPYKAHCVCEDVDGNIWVGTDEGPVYLTTSEMADNTAGFVQYKVARNDGTSLADYLLAGIDISCMAVDGAGRKWFGTNGNGVYLISADNDTQEQHFLASNSNLLSDNIESIVIDNTTGEVFFGTDKGLCSYISDATATNEDMSKDNVWAYPNPVRPEYSGLITIVGLSYNADVKICTSNGVLVNEGRSSGGTYTWDGCDEKGKAVASGVYMVQTAKSDGSKGTVCKIAIVR